MNRYDRGYFDKWYRDPRFRPNERADIERKARMVIAVAELLLGRPVRSVLDVGCGEGAWHPILRRIRPQVRYTGVDPSEYAVRRFGRRRNIRLGGFGGLGDQKLNGPFDVIVASDVLNYLPEAELRRGLAVVRDLLGGIAFLEMYASEDAVTGDIRGWRRRPAAHYRRLFGRYSLVPCGLHCYVGDALEDNLAALERGAAPRRVR
ncbi:MAG: class I SAM-dependent methyltransferase [Gemmatimonadaceae bacterium]